MIGNKTVLHTVKLKENHKHTLLTAWGMTSVKDVMGRLHINADPPADMTKKEWIEANENEVIKSRRANHQVNKTVGDRFQKK